MVFVQTTIGVKEDVDKIAKFLGIDVGQESDVNTKVWFKHIQEGDRRFIEISMEI